MYATLHSPWPATQFLSTSESIRPKSQILVSMCEVAGGNHFALYSSDSMTVSVKMYTNGLVSATVEYYTENVNEHKILNDVIQHWWQVLLCCVVLCCGAELWSWSWESDAREIKVLVLESDDRILEYDVDQMVFEERTEFQKVQIYHTKSYGNMLVLDDLQSYRCWLISVDSL
ncbi:Spermine synthase [Portunus trituberculatus]|uniref:Spermine synthase n=1 Tax=Portunus trituberculatus TaxID=210409 RepID=A0A5B7D0A6_PORTR|nr:Spermine synthase [Portunus trituberculatus]